MVPPEFSHTLSKTSQISKITSFLVVNTGSIRFIPLLLKNFLPTLLRVTVKIEFRIAIVFYNAQR